MKTIIRTITCIGLLILGLAACDEKKESILPSPLTNLKYTTTPGRIVLRWDPIEDANVHYVQVDYYNPLTGKDERRLASVYSDSLEIPDTRQKYGEYSFAVKTVSVTNDYSKTETITAVSEPAKGTWIPGSQVALTAEMLYTNAQESSEGPIANLVDGSTSTFFHTTWHNIDVLEYHYITIALPGSLTEWWYFWYAPRNNAYNKPTDFDVLGSTDGTEWFLIRNFTKDEDGLPVTSTGTYTSPYLTSDRQINHLKFLVKDTNNSAVTQGYVFWTMSEFKLYTALYIDPEAPDVE